MAKVITDITNLESLIKMAQVYGVDKNSLFMAVLHQYDIQLRVIRQIEKVIGKSEVTVTKEYIKGAENSYLHPAVKDLPKHAEAANKTAALLLDIISKLGNKSADEFMDYVKGK